LSDLAIFCPGSGRNLPTHIKSRYGVVSAELLIAIDRRQQNKITTQ